MWTLPCLSSSSSPWHSSERRFVFTSCPPTTSLWEPRDAPAAKRAATLPTCPQHIGRDICLDLFTQCLMLLMSVCRCVNNTIKPFIQLCQIRLLEEGLRVLLCNSCTTLQHAKSNALMADTYPQLLINRITCNIRQWSVNIWSYLVGTAPGLAGRFIPVMRMEAKAHKHMRPSMTSGRRCSEAGCGLLR